MKKYLLLGLLVAAIAIGGCAKEAEARGGGDPCDSFLAGILNECVVHPPDSDTVSDKRATEVGVGLDLILWESRWQEFDYKLTGEYKYDWNNGEHSAYAVVTLKLMDLVDKVKGLLGKE